LVGCLVSEPRLTKSQKAGLWLFQQLRWNRRA